MLPENWTVTTVGEHADVLTGFAFKSAEYTSTEGDVKLLRGDNIAPHKLRWREVKRFPSARAAEVARYGLRAGDFVVAMDRTWLPSGVKIAEVTETDLPCLLVQRVARLRAKETLHQGLMKHLFSDHRFNQYVRGVQTETAVPHISPADLREYPIKLPPPFEQRRIAEILSTWDRAIATVDALIVNAREQKSALMQALLTGRTRRSGFCAEWTATSIGAVCDQVTELAGEAVNLPVLSCSKHNGFVESLKYFKKKVFSDDLSGYKVVRRGMIAFPTNHVEEGSIARQDIVDAGLVSPIYCVFKPRTVDSQFLIRLLKTDAFTQRFAAATNASVDRRGSLRWKEFSKICFDLPPPDEQRAIAAVINDAERKERTLTEQRDALREEKTALMQQLLTGKRRAKPAESEAA